MNKSYSKPSTTLQSLRLEGSFMNCSVRGKMGIEFESYEDYNFGTKDEPLKEWELGFNE